MKALADAPSRIDIKYLSQFAEFIKFRERNLEPEIKDSECSSAAPEMQLPIQRQTLLLRSTVRQIETALKKELLDRIPAAPPTFFEGLIVALLLAMGYARRLHRN